MAGTHLRLLSACRAAYQQGWFLDSSPPQTDKTLAMLVLIAAGLLLGRQCVLLVATDKQNATKVAASLDSLLQKVCASNPELFGTPAPGVRFMSGEAKAWKRLQRSDAKAFSAGRLVLVLSTIQSALQQLNGFVQHVQPPQLQLVVDEVDAVFVTDDGSVDREQELYTLLGNTQGVFSFTGVRPRLCLQCTAAGLPHRAKLVVLHVCTALSCSSCADLHARQAGSGAGHAGDCHSAGL